MTRHVILVGLPGVGKTTAGAGVATRLGRRFIDFDAEIERREGMRVAEIFAAKGESHFRELERDLTAELIRTDGAVLAPGGGWIMNPGVRALVQPLGDIIYLRARPDTVLHRMGANRSARPLLQGPDPLGALSSLLAEREAAYSAADHVIDTDLLDPQQVIDKIAELASASGGG